MFQHSKRASEENNVHFSERKQSAEILFKAKAKWFEHGEKSDKCCVFQPANGCSACCLLVEIDFLMLQQLFPSLTEQNKQKIKGKRLKIMQNMQ